MDLRAPTSNWPCEVFARLEVLTLNRCAVLELRIDTSNYTIDEYVAIFICIVEPELTRIYFLHAATQVHPKNWYPIPLIFCKPWGILPNDAPCHPKLADFANCMKKKGRGMSIFISILEGDYKTRNEDARQVLSHS